MRYYKIFHINIMFVYDVTPQKIIVGFHLTNNACCKKS